MNLEKNVTDLIALFRDLIVESESALPPESEFPEGFRVEGYGGWYELSVKQLVAYLIIEAGLKEQVASLCTQPDPQAAMLEVARKSDFEPRVTPENAGPILGALIVLFTNIDSMRLYSVPIAGLLARVSDGDDDALFRAVVLDASVMQTKVIAGRISTAAICDDRSFFNKLAKAITKTKPSRPQPHLDETRFLMQILEDAGELDGMSDATLTEWAVNKTDVHPGKRDPESSVRDQRRKRDRLKGGPKN